MSSTDSFLQRYRTWLLKAMIVHADYSMLSTYSERLDSYHSHINKSTTQKERFLSIRDRENVHLIIELFRVYLRENNLGAVDFLSEFSKNEMRRNFFKDFDAFKNCFVDIFHHFFVQDAKSIFNFSTAGDPKALAHIPFLDTVVACQKRVTECKHIEKILKRFTTKTFENIIGSSFVLEIRAHIKSSQLQRQRIGKTSKEYFNQIHENYKSDQRISTRIRDNKTYCSVDDPCELQPALFIETRASATASNEKAGQLQLSTTQEFFKRTIETMVQKSSNANDNAPNVLVNYWGTGTGKTLGSLIFVCAGDVTDCFIMVHSADMINSFMDDFQSPIGMYIIQQMRPNEGECHWFKNPAYTTDTIAQWELKNNAKETIKTIYFMVYGYLFNKPVFDYYGLSTSDKKKFPNEYIIRSFHKKLWNPDHACALIMDEAHTLRNAGGKWYHNVITFFTRDEDNWPVSCDRLPIKRTLMMTATLAANQIKQAIHVLNMGCLITRKDAGDGKVAFHRPNMFVSKPITYTIGARDDIRFGANDDEEEKRSAVEKLFLSKFEVLKKGKKEAFIDYLKEAIEKGRPDIIDDKWLKLRDFERIVNDYAVEYRARKTFTDVYAELKADAPAEKAKNVPPAFKKKPKDVINTDMENIKLQFEQSDVNKIDGQVYFEFLSDLNTTLKDAGIAIIRGLGGDEGMPAFDGSRSFIAPTTVQSDRGLLFWTNSPFEVAFTEDEYYALREHRRKCLKDGSYQVDANSWRKITSAFFDFSVVHLPVLYTRFESARRTKKGSAREFSMCDLGMYAADAALKAMFAETDKSSDYRYYLVEKMVSKIQRNPKAEFHFKDLDDVITIKKEGTFILWTKNGTDEKKIDLASKKYDGAMSLFPEYDADFLKEHFKDKKMQAAVATVIHLAENKDNGPIAVFGEHVEGCDSVNHFILRMKENGFRLLGKVERSKKEKKNKVKYIELSEGADYKNMAAYTGSNTEFESLDSVDARKKARDLFNHPDNAEGKDIKIIILTSAGSTGLTLKNSHVMVDLHVPDDVVVKQQKQGRTVRRTVSKDFYAGFTRDKIKRFEAQNNKKLLPQVTEYSFLSVFPSTIVEAPMLATDGADIPDILTTVDEMVRATGAADDDYMEGQSDPENDEVVGSDWSADESEEEDSGDDMENKRLERALLPKPAPKNQKPMTYDQKTMVSLRSKVAIGNFQSLAFTSVALNSKQIAKELGEASTLIIPMGESLF